jgi:general secretion pathway protein G
MTIKKQSAFSLIEILIVVTIIGILATMIGPRIIGAMKKVKVTQAQSQLTNIKNEITQFTMDVGRLPAKLEDLVEAPADANIAKKWKGPYIKKESDLIDPWLTPIVYNRPPVRYKKDERYTDYEIYSLGADLEESDDDPHAGE